jgi:CubicO group peptidase (beta-lactamase class C family)
MMIALLKNRIFIFFIAFVFSSCQIGRFVFYNFADIRDHKKFPSRPLTASTQPFHFHQALKSRFPDTLFKKRKQPLPFEQILKQSGTVAFLIIKNDSIQYESYFEGYNAQSIVPSFSMSKSVVSMLIGCAIDEGLIQSTNEPITNYIPELKKNGFEKVQIEHLLQMTSGISFNEGYFNPLGDAAAFYYGRKLYKKMFRMKLKNEPGKTFEYISGNTQLLGLVLERALKGKTITSYLQEKLWSPLGMEYDASWSIDRNKNGIEKAFCCINSVARDYAKLGRLYLNKGKWEGQQLISENWVKHSTKSDTLNGAAPYYKYQWWIPTLKGDFMAQGLLGQYIYVNPAKNLIIVRLGKKSGKWSWWSMLPEIARFY